MRISDVLYLSLAEKPPTESVAHWNTHKSESCSGSDCRRHARTSCASLASSCSESRGGASKKGQRSRGIHLEKVRLEQDLEAARQQRIRAAREVEQKEARRQAIRNLKQQRERIRRLMSGSDSGMSSIGWLNALSITALVSALLTETRLHARRSRRLSRWNDELTRAGQELHNIALIILREYFGAMASAPGSRSDRSAHAHRDRASKLASENFLSS